MDQKGNDKDRKCWNVELTDENCNKRQKKNCWCFEFKQENCFCRASTTILNNNSYGPKRGDPNICLQISLCKDMFDQKNGGQKGNKIEQKKMDQKENDKGFCRASTTILNNNSYGPKRGDPNICLQISLCKDMFDQKNGGQKGNKIEQKKMDQKENDKDCKSYAVSCTGGIVGAVVGGTVFGSVITMIVFLCFRRAFLFPKTRNSDCKPRSDENLQESLPPVDETVYNEINDQAIIRIQPMRRTESAHVSTREETYSHLHESDKEDMNESYDHARPVPSACVREVGYGVLTRVGNNNREVQTIATDDAPSKIQNDNYFIIEPQ
ncbi:uncharacterized protein LOC128159763 [Crassostrea angulata]|uniref:uncharacterized protein LOC128159763 n=1 Tax=Magallana angulata TaxID=2784310 RepID=UPI0022B1B08F|nr:uncharacterized protein LOC128159763 [Crassostrea angulata]